MEFWQLTEMIWKRKWLILLSAVSAISLTYGLTRFLGARWVATAQLVAPAQPLAQPDTADAGGASDSESDQVAGYTAMLKSRAVIEPVAQEFGGGSMTLDKLLGDIDFSLAGPHLYELSFTDTDPNRATRVANLLADRLVTVNRQLMTNEQETAVRFLQDRLADVNGKLAAARVDLDKYQYSHHVVGNVQTNLNANYATLLSAQHARDDLSAKLAQATARLQTAQSQLASAPKISPLELGATSGVLSEQLDELEKTREHLNELRVRLKDKHPLVKQARAHLNALQKTISAEMATEARSEALNPAVGGLAQQIRSLKVEIAGDKAQLAAIDNQTRAAQDAIHKYKGIDPPLAMLTSQITELQSDHDNLVDRLNKARMALDATSRLSSLVVINPVGEFNPPVNTAKGRTVKYTLVAAICAILCSTALIIVLNSVDRRVRSIRQAELALPVRLLASIPSPQPTLSAPEIARVTDLHPQSLCSEAYRFLGLHLLNGSASDARSIMVLAAKAEQGSTATLTNLGFTLAQAGKRVMLVDANIRTPEMHAVFDVDNCVGFTDLLKSPDPVRLARAVHPTSNPNLNFITSGPSPKNAWQLFRSDNLERLSKLLREHADYVLYDTASSLMFTDALNLAPIVDAAILCVRALEPLTGAESRLIELLEQNDVAVLGSVLCGVPSDVVEGLPSYRDYVRELQPPSDGHAERLDIDTALAAPSHEG